MADAIAGDVPVDQRVDMHRQMKKRRQSVRAGPIRIIVADDRRLCRECVRLLIESIDPDLQVIEVTDAEGIEAGLGPHREHSVVLYNLVITDPDGVDFIGSLAESISDVPLVVMCDKSDRELMRGCLKRGARAFLPSTTPGPLLVAILHLVLANGVYVPPELALDLDMDMDRNEAGHGGRRRNGGIARREAAIAEHFPQLTRRQRDVLALLSQGMSNRGIADALNMCENTVKAHVKQVMRKLEADNRTQAALMADRLVA